MQFFCYFEMKNIVRDEQELIADIIAGDTAAMKRLYDCHVGYLTAVASRYIPDEDDLKDVMQDSFVKVFTTVGSFQYRGEGSLRAWMTRIVVNEAINCLKRNRNSGQLSNAIESEEISEYEEPDMDNVPMDVVYEMIRNLPAGYRSVFNLYVFENRSHKEIAAMLGIKESTSASQFHRAKAMLARQINEYQHTKSVQNGRTMA